MVCLLAFKILLPNHFYMSRGNHEARSLNRIYGFQGEVKKKYDDDVYECFCELFCTLPLGHILNKKVLVVHGGLFSKDGIKLEELKEIERIKEPPEQGKYILYI
jgi:serine/threonine-protein phosphatase 5